MSVSSTPARSASRRIDRPASLKKVRSGLALVFGIPHTVVMSTVPLINERKLSSFLYAELERSIVECSLLPGALLSDRQLAEQHGASRTPVREALQQLELAGLAERGKHTGWRVAAIDLNDVEELYELRTLLELAGLEQIVGGEDAVLDRVASMFDDFAAPMAKVDVTRYLERDDEFHHLLVEATGNSRLIKAYHVVDRQLARCKRFVSNSDDARREESLLEHQAVCKALGRRDVDEARSALIAHFGRAKKTLALAVQASLLPS